MFIGEAFEYFAFTFGFSTMRYYVAECILIVLQSVLSIHLYVLSFLVKIINYLFIIYLSVYVLIYLFIYFY